MIMRPLSRASLLTALLTLACTPTGGPPAPAPSPTPSAAASPGPSPTPTPGAASPTPGAVPTPPGVALVGQVLDQAGRPIAGAQVSARAVGEAESLAGAVTDAAGRYELSGLPLVVDLTIEASSDGKTPRRQVVALVADRKALDFGGPQAPAFFLSPHPEINATEPRPGTHLADPARLVYALSLSEALDAENRRRFEQAVRVLPASSEAGGGDDLALLAGRYPLARSVLGLGNYLIGPASTFLDGGARPQVSWSADGRVATLRFAAPLLRHRSRSARYQVVLEAGEQPIRDAEGLTLGTGPSGALGSWPAPGELVLGAFWAPEAWPAPLTGLAEHSDEARWAATHAHQAAFTVAEDRLEPRLLEVELDERAGDTQLRLTFDEPLAAFDGSLDGARGAGTGLVAGDLGGISFAVGEREALQTTRLDGEREGDELLLDPRAATSFGADDERGREVFFEPGAFATSASGAADGTITLAPDGLDPAVLVLTIHGREAFFSRELREIAVRVQGLADPAGNRRGENLADENVVKGNL